MTIFTLFAIVGLVAHHVVAQADPQIDAARGGATPCRLESNPKITGVCTRSSQCTGPNSFWVASFSWGKRRSRGCENTPSGFRCCVKPQATPGAPGTTSALATVATVAADTTTQAVPTAPPSNGGDEASGVRAQYLSFHNDERACYGVPALTWSSAAELTARKYANKCVFEHSTRAERNNMGENLAAGSGARDEISLLQG
jgi:hypothetical protein